MGRHGILFFDTDSLWASLEPEWSSLSASSCCHAQDLGNLSLTVVGATDSGCPAVELHCGDINVVEDYFARLQG